MKTWDEFVNEFTEDELVQFIEDGKILTTTGVVGECLLRTKANEWGENIGEHSHVIFTMRDLIFFATTYFTKKFFEVKEKIENELENSDVPGDDFEKGWYRGMEQALSYINTKC